MAVYDYRCRSCDATFEVRRAVTEEPGEVRCPGGHDDVTRLWSAVAIGGRSGAGGPAAPAAAPAGGCCGGGCCG
jgi:putative FmdB family regulatory protein